LFVWLVGAAYISSTWIRFKVVRMDDTYLYVSNSEHFVGGGTELMVWVGAAVPTGEMRC